MNNFMPGARREKELEERCQKYAKTIEEFKPQLKRLEMAKVDIALYSDLIHVFVRVHSFDDLFTQSLEVFSRHLRAQYSGVFWLNTTADMLECRQSRNYRVAAIPKIPREGSIMGRCLAQRKVLFVPSIAAEKDGCNLNQNPPEYNAIYAPVILMGQAVGVICLSNLELDVGLAVRETLETLVPMTTSYLERMLLQEENSKNQRQLDAINAIARLLDKTLEEEDIYRNICQQISAMLPSVMTYIVRFDSNGNSVETLAKWPETAWLGDSPSSHDIILRNLIAEYNNGLVLIPDVHHDPDRRWAWPDMRVRSLCMAPLTRHQDSACCLVAVGPSSEIYSKEKLSLLSMIATQAALTLDRAAHFRLQENLARRDGLTGLYNHRVFQESVRKEMDRFHRYNQSLSIIMVDIDHFKQFNDTYGHPVGDQVIRRVAAILARAPRTTDKVFRYGGEEFCLLLPQTQLPDAVLVAERIRRLVESDHQDGLCVTVSLGVATAMTGESVQDFIDRADKALYAAKSSGRNQVAASQS